MKQLLFLIFFLPLCAFQVSAQIVNNGPGTFVWTNTAPKHNPGASGAKFAVNKNTFIWYEWLSDTTWTASGDRIQTISGCSAPNYTPGNHQSRVVINGCTSPNVPELYFYTGSAWTKLNSGTTYTAGAGINISGTTISADTALLATQYDLSQVGVSWPLLAPDGTTSAPSYSFQNSPGSGLWKDGATIILQSQSGEAGNPLLFAGGDASGDAEFAGDFTLRGGNATGSEGGGGRLFMFGGNSTGPLGQGGGVGIVGGNGTDVAGQVGIQGGTVNGVSLHRAPVAIGSQLTPWNLTTTERNTIPNALTSGIIYNTNATANDGSTGALQLYNGSAWKSFAYDVSADLAGTGNGLAVLNSSGRFVRGTTDPANVVALSGQTAGQIPKWNGSTWVPANDSIGGGGTPGGSNTQIQYNNSGVFGGSSNFIWDNTNSRLGVRTASPSASVTAQGAGLTSSSASLRALRGNGTSAFEVLDDGVINIPGRVNITNNSLVVSGSIAMSGASVASNISFNVAGSFTDNSSPFTRTGMNFAQNFSASSSSSNYTGIWLQPTINQTGTANGVIRGIRYNPALTSIQGAHYAATFSSGFVGIGTETPTQSLHTTGNARIDGAIMPGNSAGTSGQVLVSSGAGVAPVWTTTTLKETATLDFPSTGAHTNSDLTVTVTGAAVGDAVSVAPGLAAISDHSCYTAWVSATNTVTVRFNHYGTSGATDPASASFNVIVHKF